MEIDVNYEGGNTRIRGTKSELTLLAVSLVATADDGKPRSELVLLKDDGVYCVYLEREPSIDERLS